LNDKIGKIGPNTSSLINLESNDGFLIIVGPIYLSLELIDFSPPIKISPPELLMHSETLSTAYSFINFPTKSLN